MAFGAFCGVISFIYNLKKIGLFWQTAIHSPLLIGGYYVPGTSLGWFNSVNFIFLVWFVLIYLLIWIVIYLYNRSMAKRLNEELKKQ